MAQCVYVMVIPEWKEGLDGYEVEREIVKIGYLRKFRDLESLERARSNYSRKWRASFGVRYAVRLPENLGKKAESLLHYAFESRRVYVENLTGEIGREFFDLDPEEAKSALELLLIRGGREVYDAEDYLDDDEDWDDDDGDDGDDDDGPRGFFRRSDIPIGAKLTFVNDPSKTCIVTGQRPLRVRYGQNSNLSLTALTKRLTGYANVSGPMYWKYNGVLVSELPNV